MTREDKRRFAEEELVAIACKAIDVNTGEIVNYVSCFPQYEEKVKSLWGSKYKDAVWNRDPFPGSRISIKIQEFLTKKEVSCPQEQSSSQT
jgi:hypothetical protein